MEHSGSAAGVQAEPRREPDPGAGERYGTFSLYLENGNFSAPQVLWSSTKNEPQKLWVEKNTHTHANWVFTAPGEYLLKVTASAELSDGSTVSDTRYLKFAVGDSASADALYAMEAQARGSSGSASATSRTPVPRRPVHRHPVLLLPPQRAIRAVSVLSSRFPGVLLSLASWSWWAWAHSSPPDVAAPPRSVRLWMKYAVTVRERIGNSGY